MRDTFRTLLRANFDGPDPAMDCLVNDLVYMAMSEYRTDLGACYREWIRRIGGTGNIPAYLSTLQAGHGR
jgi:hypothetical protein